MQQQQSSTSTTTAINAHCQLLRFLRGSVYGVACSGSGGGGGNLFSARGVGNGLTRGTAILAVCFFVTSIALTMLSTHGKRPGSVFEGAPTSDSQPDAGGAGGTGGNLLPNLGQGTGGQDTGGQGTQPTTPQVPTNN